MDIQEIKSQYYEYNEDIILIENQKKKLVERVKKIIKTQNITSLEDEEKTKKF